MFWSYNTGKYIYQIHSFTAISRIIKELEMENIYLSVSTTASYPIHAFLIDII